MGLDMYAYAAAKANADWGSNEQREIAYWRKHPNLHGWMEQLWHNKGFPLPNSDDPMFNGVELELTWEDLDQLEEDIQNDRLPSTSGFFFGDNPPDSESIRNDIDFIYAAKRAIGDGLYVFYSSWW